MPGRLRRLGGRGYSLVALLVALIVLNIAVTAALQLWSTVMQREREEELIFRGLQYAEAIRVFQARFKRPPTSLEELFEVEPRSIRRLWSEPVSPSGGWIPILAGEGSDVTQVAGGQPPSGSSGDALSQQLDVAFGSAPAPGPGSSSSGFASGAPESQIGPIEGVRPTATGEAMRVFLGRTAYESWEFRALMLAVPPVTPEGVPRAPRIDPGALGRPWPDGLEPAAGSAPHPGGEAGAPSGTGEEDPFGDEGDEGSLEEESSDEEDPFGDEEDPFEEDDPFGEEEDGA